MSIDERIQKLDEHIANRVRQWLKGVHEQVGNQLGEEISRQLAAAGDLLPESLVAEEIIEPLRSAADDSTGTEDLKRLKVATIAIDSAQNQAEILSALLNGGQSFASRLALFLTRADAASGWNGAGFGAGDSGIRGMTLEYREDGPWYRLSTGKACVPLSAGDCGRLCSRLESSLPKDGVLIPVVLRDRVAAALYADRLEDNDSLNLDALQLLAYLAAQAIETLPFRERKTATPTLVIEEEAENQEDGLSLWGVSAAAAAAATTAVVAGTALSDTDEVEAAVDEADSTETEEDAEIALEEAAEEVVAEVEAVTEVEAVAEMVPEAVEEEVAAVQPAAALPETQDVAPAVSEVLADEPEAAAPEVLETDFVEPEPVSAEPVELVEQSDPVEQVEEELEVASELPSNTAVEEIPAIEESFVVEESPTIEETSAEVEVVEVGADHVSYVEVEAEEETFEVDESLETASTPSPPGALPWETEDATKDEPAAAWEEEAPVEPEVSGGGILWEAEEEAVEAEVESEEVVAEPAPVEWQTEAESVAVDESHLPDVGLKTLQYTPPALESTPGTDAPARFEGDETVLLSKRPSLVPPAPEPVPMPVPEPEPSAQEFDGDETHPGMTSGSSAVPVPEPAVRPARASEVAPPSDIDGPGWAFKKPAAAVGEDAEMHDKAKRLARLLVSEIKLYNEEQVEEGQRNRDIYERLKEDIDRSRQMYEDRVDERIRSTNDYFYQELVRTLAAGDPQALGI